MPNTSPTPTDAPVLAERRGAVLVLTLHRPDRLNAWNDALEERYFALLDEAENDPEVRAIVVTGAGRGFCAGADMDDLASVDATVDMRRPRPRYFPLTVRKPMIAAINGAAAGLGLVEALYCDLRFTTPEAKLTTSFARRGLIAEYGSSWLLARLVGSSRALDLLLSGRVVQGAEALVLGLVDRVVAADELLDTAVAYAQDLAAHCSPWAMATIKAQIQEDPERSFGRSAEAADRLMLTSFGLADVQEGVASYLDGRAPDFAPLPPRT